MAKWRRKSPVFARVYALACKHAKISKHHLMVLLGGNPNHHGRNAQRVTHGEAFRFERFLMAARLARIPDAHAAVLWAREQIPDEYAELREFVGCTLPTPKTRKLAGTGKGRDLEAAGEARELLKQYARRGRPVHDP